MMGANDTAIECRSDAGAYMPFVKMSAVGCPHCAATIDQTDIICPKCGKNVKDRPAPANLLDEFALMQNMTNEQRVLFQAQLSGRRKDSTTGVLLAVFLGGLGVHHFYLGNVGIGVFYVLFCWTFIPAIVALLEAFAMPGRVRSYNNRMAGEIATQIKALATPAA